MWVIDENNRSLNNWHVGENNRGSFQELQNRIIGKIRLRPNPDVLDSGS